MKKKKKTKSVIFEVMIPVRITNEERRRLRDYAEETGDRFMTRAIRRLILEAINKK